MTQRITACLSMSYGVWLTGRRAESRCVLSLLQAYFMLDEMLIAGELQEPSKKVPHTTDASLCSHLGFLAYLASLLTC